MNVSQALQLNILVGGIFASVFLLSMVIFRIVAGGTFKNERLEKHQTYVVPRFLMAWMFWLINPLRRFLVENRVSPNYITLSSLFVSVLAGVSFAFGNFQIGAWVMIFAAILDILDGWVARELKIVTKSGEFLDSTIDRYAEIIVFAGLMYYYRASDFMLFLIFFVITGSLAFSYIRSKGDLVGVSSKTNFMQRHERITILTVAGIFSPFLALALEPKAPEPFYHLMVFAILALAVLINIGAVLRLVGIFNAIKDIENKKAAAEEESVEDKAAVGNRK